MTYEAAPEVSQRMAPAISSASPPRSIGTAPLTRSTRSGSPPLAWISRMPALLTSAATGPMAALSN